MGGCAPGFIARCWEQLQARSGCRSWPFTQPHSCLWRATLPTHIPRCASRLHAPPIRPQPPMHPPRAGRRPQLDAGAFCKERSLSCALGVTLGRFKSSKNETCLHVAMHLELHCRFPPRLSTGKSKQLTWAGKLNRAGARLLATTQIQVAPATPGPERSHRGAETGADIRPCLAPPGTRFAFKYC